LITTDDERDIYKIRGKEREARKKNVGGGGRKGCIKKNRWGWPRGDFLLFSAVTLFSGAFVCALRFAAFPPPPPLSTHPSTHPPTYTYTHTHTEMHTHTDAHPHVDFRSEKDGVRMESFLVRLFLPPLPPTTTLLFRCKGEEARI